jgi:hypothetical protein
MSLAIATRRGDGGTQPARHLLHAFLLAKPWFATVEPLKVPASIGMQARDPTSDAIEGEKTRWAPSGECADSSSIGR